MAGFPAERKLSRLNPGITGIIRKNFSYDSQSIPSLAFCEAGRAHGLCETFVKAASGIDPTRGEAIDY
jgi:hypothetical protein